MPSKMRFHDLRHSCAALLHANVAAFMDVREWLDHSDIGTHLDYNSKKNREIPKALEKQGFRDNWGPRASQENGSCGERESSGMSWR